MRYRGMHDSTGVALWTALLAFANRLRNNALMPRKTQSLEARPQVVEQGLVKVKAALAGKPAARWYRDIVGSFKGDDALGEIARLGRLIRQGKLKR